MSARYREILETFSGDKSGECDAWDAVEKYAKLVTSNGGADRFAVGVRQVVNEARQKVWATVLVERTD